jgi:hypothetical protein
MQPKISVWFGLLVLLAVRSAAAGDVLYVVCHEGVLLDAAEVRYVYLGEKQFANTIRLLPVDNVAAQVAFLERVLKVDATRYTGIWTKKWFRDGVNPPPVKAGNAEALAYVKQTQGGCSYLGVDPGPGVTVIARY